MRFVTTTKSEIPNIYNVFMSLIPTTNLDALKKLFVMMINNEDIKLYKNSVMRPAGSFYFAGDVCNIDHSCTQSTLEKLKSLIQDKDSPKLRKYKWFFNHDGSILSGVSNMNDDLPNSRNTVTNSKMKEIIGGQGNCINPWLQGRAGIVYTEIMKDLSKKTFVGVEIEDNIYLLSPSMLPLILFSRCGDSIIRNLSKLTGNKNWLEKTFWFHFRMSQPELYKEAWDYEFTDVLKPELFNTLIRAAGEKK